MKTYLTFDIGIVDSSDPTFQLHSWPTQINHEFHIILETKA